MMNRLAARLTAWTLVAAILVSSAGIGLPALTGTAPEALAHGTSHDGHLAHEFLEGNEKAAELERFLHDRRERFLRAGEELTPIDQRLAGERLAEATLDEWREYLRAHGPRNFSERAAGEFRHRVLSRLNPVKLGRWLWQVTQKRGAAIAIVFGLTELFEQITVVYATTTMKHMYFIPLSVFHVWDMAAVAMTFGVPKAFRGLRRWIRLGGIRATYLHWVRQRQITALDWEGVLAVEEFRTGGGRRTHFAVTAGSRVSSWLPRPLRIVFDAKALAADESAVTVRLRELEAIASDAGVDIKLIRPFRAETDLYSALLMREIHSSRAAHEALASLLEKKGLVGAADLALPAGSSDDLIAILRGERTSALSADVLAQRYFWYFEFRLGTIESLAEDGAATRRGEVYRELRKIRSRLGSGKGLGRFVESPAGGFSQKVVLEEARAILNRLEELERRHPGLRSDLGTSCDRLLI